LYTKGTSTTKTYVPFQGLAINSSLEDFDKLYEMGQNVARSRPLLHAASNSAALTKVVDALQADSQTALGPAVAVALGQFYPLLL